MTNTLPKLNLPRRWENLERQAAEARIDPLEVVERVDAAASHVDELLDRVRTGGGLFEVFYGASGSGKTTFVRSLPKFFNNVRVEAFDVKSPLSELPDVLKDSYNVADSRQRVIVIQGRDNPNVQEIIDAKNVLARFLNLFRTPAGEAVVLWPITDREAADEIAKTAWAIGSDAMVDHHTRGIFHFDGLDRAIWPELADRTSQSLNGDKLDAFGITGDAANDLLVNSDTISLFFSKATAKANAIRDQTWSVLKNKVVAHVWVALLSDDPISTYSTTTGLTQGSRSRVDVELISEFIDAPGGGTNYVDQWKRRRESLAHFLRTIDLRIFDLPPNVALAAVRRFAQQDLKNRLKQKSTALDTAKNAMRSTRLYKAILDQIGGTPTAFVSPKKATEDTSEEYLRIQQTAANNDKPLNQALALLLDACLSEDAPGLVSVVSEKKSLPNSSLKPDIQLKIGENEYICIEATWRSSGKRIDGAGGSGQDTSKSGHMKKYTLDKANDYVVGLGLGG